MNKSYLYSFLIFIVFLLIYCLGTFDKVPFGDCIGFVLTAEDGVFINSATATSHFLYINTAIAIKNILGTDGIIANRILVIVSAALTTSIIFQIALLVSKKIWIAIITSFVFGFSFTFWRNAEIVEVYTFTAVWISLYLLFLLKPFYEEYAEQKTLIFCSVFLSFAILSHIQNIFLIPTFLILLIYFNKSKKAVITSISILLLTFGFIIFLNNLANLPLKAFYSSGDGDWVANSFKKTISEYANDLLVAIAYLCYNFNFFTLLGVVGVIKLYQLKRQVFWLILPLAVLNFGFATFYAVSDNYIFFLPFNILFAASIAYGILHIPYQAAFKKISLMVLITPFLYYTAYYIASNSERGQDFHQAKLYKGGLRYYLLPWMNDNVGILEFTLDKGVSADPVHWMTEIAEKYIMRLREQGKTENEIREL